MPERTPAPFGPPGYFYECPRWHEGRWWASDMRGRTVYSFSPDGEARVELALEHDRPGGLGWTPEGDLLIVSMDRRQLLRRPRAGGDAQVFADLSGLSGDVAGFTNDMAVSRDGHAYVGFDSDPNRYAGEALGMVVHVTPDGRAEVAARGLSMPNGIMFTPDGATLVVAETMIPQLTAFGIGADGALEPARRWAWLDPRQDRRPGGGPDLGAERATLDGCGMDAEGYVWAADLRSGCLRIAEGGDIVDAVFLPDGLRTWACEVGGEDGRTLMLCGADDNFHDRMSRKGSQLYTLSLA